MADLLYGLGILILTFFVVGSATFNAFEKYQELKSNNEYSACKCPCNCRDGKSEVDRQKIEKQCG